MNAGLISMLDAIEQGDSQAFMEAFTGVMTSNQEAHDVEQLEIELMIQALRGS